MYHTGLWGSLAILSGLGPEDPSSNLGSPIFKKVEVKICKFELVINKTPVLSKTRSVFDELGNLRFPSESGQPHFNSNTFINHQLSPQVMPVAKKFGSPKRYGARYGRRIKEKLGKIEAEQKKRQVCPYCNKAAVRRKSVGIWLCKRCNAQFTGFAYSVSKKIVAEEKVDKSLEVTKFREKEVIETGIDE